MSGIFDVNNDDFQHSFWINIILFFCTEIFKGAVFFLLFPAILFPHIRIFRNAAVQQKWHPPHLRDVLRIVKNWLETVNEITVLVGVGFEGPSFEQANLEKNNMGIAETQQRTIQVYLLRWKLTHLRCYGCISCQSMSHRLALATISSHRGECCLVCDHGVYQHAMEGLLHVQSMTICFLLFLRFIVLAWYHQ